LLKEAPHVGDSDYVFTTNGKTPISGWSRAKEQLDNYAKIAEWRVHDLRRTVAIGPQKLGIALQVTESVLVTSPGPALAWSASIKDTTTLPRRLRP
jgi:hypothetical protein